MHPLQSAFTRVSLFAAVALGLTASSFGQSLPMGPDSDGGSFVVTKMARIFTEGGRDSAKFQAVGKVEDFEISSNDSDLILLGTTKFSGSDGGSYSVTAQAMRSDVFDLTVTFSDGSIEIVPEIIEVPTVKCDMVCTMGMSRMGYESFPGGIPLGPNQDEGGPGSKTNNIEIKYVVCGVPPGTYVNIKRTKTRTVTMNGMVISMVTNADDDSHDNDEINETDAGGNVSSVDTPGFRAPAPGTPDGTNMTYCGNFTESACVGGMTLPGSSVDWHSKLDVTAMNGMWVCNSADIGAGHVVF